MGFGQVIVTLGAVVMLASPQPWVAGSSAAKNADPSRWHTLKMGSNHVTQKLRSGKHLTVSISSDSLVADSSVGAKMWGGAPDFPAHTRVRMLEIELADTSIYVPLSAYADLGQPAYVEFRPYSKGLCFQILGGDASTAYAALFFIERGFLRRRRVEAGEFPEWWEETTYAWPTAGDE